ncbi:hypothetical protein SDC9_120239 [bioreactor metagenome]|uniref:Uncharacterized protein n=1 Tax=bioreactor metagenome TaxID=1076179 RepID=A0A645C962_9ZZZZ
MLSCAECAGRVGENDACLQELLDHSGLCTCELNFSRARGDYRADLRADLAAACHQNIVGCLDIFKTSVRAGSDVDLIYGCSSNFPDRLHVVGGIGA